MQDLRKVTLAILLSIVLLLWIQAPAQAFKVNIHEAITREALAAVQPIVDGERLQFSEAAIRQIVFANKDTDQLVNQFNTEKHFDGEDFLGGSQRLIQLKEQTIAKVTREEPSAFSAQTDLGGALHTVQDFYAHSNWVNLGHSSTDINAKLGHETFSGTDRATPTCPDNPSTLGGAGLRELTSGYFTFTAGVIPSCSVPSGKCRHGLLLVCPAGINKDDDNQPGFSTARALAVEASKDFLNQIFSDSRVVSNTQAIKLLLGIS